MYLFGNGGAQLKPRVLDLIAGPYAMMAWPLEAMAGYRHLKQGHVLGSILGAYPLDLMPAAIRAGTRILPRLEYMLAIQAHQLRNRHQDGELLALATVVAHIAAFHGYSLPNAPGASLLGISKLVLLSISCSNDCPGGNGLRYPHSGHAKARGAMTVPH